MGKTGNLVKWKTVQTTEEDNLLGWVVRKTTLVENFNSVIFF